MLEEVADKAGEPGTGRSRTDDGPGMAGWSEQRRVMDGAREASTSDALYRIDCFAPRNTYALK